MVFAQKIVKWHIMHISLKRIGELLTGPHRNILSKLFILCLIILGLYAGYFYWSLPDVSLLLKNIPKSTALMDYRKQMAQKDHKRYRIRHRWVGFSRIPDLLKKSVRISEDASFYKHHGVDYTELKESFIKNIKNGAYRRGGSTITQQLAKNLYLSNQKSLMRKIRELFIAWRLENVLSKNRIFSLYLNEIEFGPGIFGVQAAARRYFHKDVKDLNLEEIIRLTAVIPRPLSVRPTSRDRRLMWKARWILHKLLKYKYIKLDQYKATAPAFEQ